MPKWPSGDKGPVCVVWDYGGANLRIDPYNDTVRLTMTDEIEYVYEDGYGRTPVDAIFAGTVPGLEIPMARNTLATLNSLLPGTSITGTDYLKYKVKAGCDMYEDAKAVVLKPKCDLICDPDSKTWMRIFKCYPYRDFDIPFNFGDQRVRMVRFVVFPNQESGYEGELYEEGVQVP